ncbi:MAG: hypothetical protein KAY59_10825, partial [Acidobacteria bacterium]|nr:hypothetical protein [Acidobacteriota bacterium]
KAAPMLSDTAIAMIGLVALTLISWLDAPADRRWMNAAIQFVTMGITFAMILRVGLFSAAVMFITVQIFANSPITLDSSRLYAGGSWVMVAAATGLALAGFWLARSPFSAQLRALGTHQR